MRDTEFGTNSETLWNATWCQVAGYNRLNTPLLQEQKEDIWLSPMTKAPTPTEKSKKQHDNTARPPKNFDYTTIADRLGTVSWSNDSHPTGMVKPINGIPTFPLTVKAL